MNILYSDTSTPRAAQYGTSLSTVEIMNNANLRIYDGATGRKHIIDPRGRIYVLLRIATIDPGSENYLYYSDDDGQNWTNAGDVLSDITGGNYKNKNCRMCIDRDSNIHIASCVQDAGGTWNNQRIWYRKFDGSSFNTSQAVSNCYISGPYGANWNKFNLSGIAVNNQSVVCVIFHGNAHGTFSTTSIDNFATHSVSINSYDKDRVYLLDLGSEFHLFTRHSYYGNTCVRHDKWVAGTWSLVEEHVICSVTGNQWAVTKGPDDTIYIVGGKYNASAVVQRIYSTGSWGTETDIITGLGSAPDDFSIGMQANILYLSFLQGTDFKIYSNTASWVLEDTITDTATSDVPDVGFEAPSTDVITTSIPITTLREGVLQLPARFLIDYGAESAGADITFYGVQEDGSQLTLATATLDKIGNAATQTRRQEVAVSSSLQIPIVSYFWVLTKPQLLQELGSVSVVSYLPAQLTNPQDQIETTHADRPGRVRSDVVPTLFGGQHRVLDHFLIHHQNIDDSSTDVPSVLVAGYEEGKQYLLIGTVTSTLYGSTDTIPANTWARLDIDFANEFSDMGWTVGEVIHFDAAYTIVANCNLRKVMPALFSRGLDTITATVFKAIFRPVESFRFYLYDMRYSRELYYVEFATKQFVPVIDGEAAP